MILFGGVGAGKDHLLTALLRIAVDHHGFSAQWIDGLEFFMQARDIIGGNKSEVDFVNGLLKSDVLAISDPVPPSGSLTDFQLCLLHRVIDGRYRRRKATWLTCNVEGGTDLGQRVGIPVLDRLRHNAVSFHCNWESYRRPLPVLA